jgi:dienelactone hydrolase
MPDQFAGDAAPGSGNRITSPNTSSAAQYQTLPTTTSDVTASQPPPSPSFIDRIKLGFADTAKSFMLDMWLARQTPEKVLPRLISVIETVQDEYADAISHGGGIYGVGYCFGAKYILILARGEGGLAAHPALSGKGFDLSGVTSALPTMPAMPVMPSIGRMGSVRDVLGGSSATTSTTTQPENRSDDVEATAGTAASTAPASAPAAPPAQSPPPTATPHSTIDQQQPEETTPAISKSSFPTPLLKTAAIAHGTLVTHPDVLQVHPSVPTLCIAVEDDPLFPSEVLDLAQKAWAANEAECKVEVYKGVPHGFAVLGEYEDEGIRKEQERAWEEMRGWLDGH